MTDSEFQEKNLQLLVEYHELRAQLAENEAKQEWLQAEFHRDYKQEESK